MPKTNSRPFKAHDWALTATFVPAALVAAVAFTIAVSVDHTSCEGFSCPSFGYGVISMYAALTAAAVGGLGLLATAGLGALWPSLRIHPARLGLLGALTGWIILGLIATTL